MHAGSADRAVRIVLGFAPLLAGVGRTGPWASWVGPLVMATGVLRCRGAHSIVKVNPCVFVRPH